MILFFQISAWICFVGLVFYVILYSKNEEKMDSKVFVIRKIWYLLYLLGALIYWTSNPESIFSNWENYLIIATVFILVDAFIFLNLYLRKVGNNELERLTKSVSGSNELIETNLSMIKNMLYLLNSEGVMGYYGNKEEYLHGLKILLRNYATKEDMSVDLLPFSNEEEKEESLSFTSNTNTIRSKLDRLETYYEDKVALHPVQILNETYVLKIHASRPVSEIEGLLFSILIYIYDISIPEDVQIEY